MRATGGDTHWLNADTDDERTLRGAGERGADERHCGAHVGVDERCGEAEDTIAGGPQVRIPVLIELRAALVKAAIHFDDQAGGGCTEICNVATDDDLTTECDAETAAAQLIPQASLRRLEMLAHALRANCELMQTLRDLATLRR